MPNRIFCGTSGYSYPSWKPGFYPAKLPAKKFLEYYASRLNSVESNYTFRGWPSEEMIANWIAATPSEFVFALKAHQSITHLKKAPEESARLFFEKIEPLRGAGRLGPVLLQFPPSRSADLGALRAILDTTPAGVRVAAEFRHPSWFSGETYKTLSASGAALCLAESERLETPPVLTADFVYFRLRKPDYGPGELSAIRKEAERLAHQGRDVFVYFMHQEEPSGPLYAEAVLNGPRSS
ncbi:MAG: DUF72 domain-containing protein [Acidobacteria bacterium]|nr:DUF72 domain-containing protein [Acidobacteriota bacterium]